MNLETRRQRKVTGFSEKATESGHSRTWDRVPEVEREREELFKTLFLYPNQFPHTPKNARFCAKAPIFHQKRSRTQRTPGSPRDVYGRAKNRRQGSFMSPSVYYHTKCLFTHMESRLWLINPCIRVECFPLNRIVFVRDVGGCFVKG